MDRPASTRRDRLALGALLLGTAGLNLWGLGSSGWANSFYSAAVQAGSQSWTAFFFGASDAAGSITVDKPPLALWPMALSVRLFGLSSWSILVPQALMGVAAVALLVAAVRRSTGSPVAGLFAGLCLAVTPVAVLMFRFNNPDALLTLLLVAAAYATLRAVEASEPTASGGPLRWLVGAGALVGLAFLTKMLQSFLVLPALALPYLLFAAVPLTRRLLHLLAAFGAMLVAGSWWVVIVELWPASSRPYIGGSQTNSVLELVLGYNGLGRLTGEQVGSVSSGHGWGRTGIFRLFGTSSGPEISWLLPAALALPLVAFWLLRRRPRPQDRPVLAALTLWAAWTWITAVTFSFMGGIYHPYYTVALAPAVAAATAIGSLVAWRHHDEPRVARALATTVVVSCSVAVLQLSRTDDWLPWLKFLVGAGGLLAAWLLVRGPRWPRRRTLAMGLSLASVLAGPTAFSVATASTPHTGAVPDVGPPREAVEFYGLEMYVVEPPPVGTLLDASTPSPAVVARLLDDADDFTWVAAVTGSNSASGFQLATQRPVMPIGGFNGTDPWPTPPDFRRLVREGRIHYYLPGGAGMDLETNARGYPIVRTGSDDAWRIDAWVRSRFHLVIVDGTPLYDLTRPADTVSPRSASPSGASARPSAADR